MITNKVWDRLTNRAATAFSSQAVLSVAASLIGLRISPTFPVPSAHPDHLDADIDEETGHRLPYAWIMTYPYSNSLAQPQSRRPPEVLLRSLHANQRQMAAVAALRTSSRLSLSRVCFAYPLNSTKGGYKTVLLQRLSEYADRLCLPPPMYQSVPIRYIIELDRDGSHPNIVDQKSDEHKYGKPQLVPSVKRSSSVRPKLLADNSEYVLGLARETSSAERVLRQHDEFVTLVNNCAAATGEPTVMAVARFMATLDLNTL